MRIALLPALLALPATAHAFCGTYVGSGDGGALTASTSQVILARSGDRTTLTFTNDYQGDQRAFAMVMPVPEVLAEEDVRVVESSLFDALNAYSSPRLVAYSCWDLGYGEYWDEGDDWGRSWGCGLRDDVYDTDFDLDPGGGEGGSLDVTVEETFTVGAYEIVVLTSEESSDLLTWLQREGYGVSDEAEAVLAEYIEADQAFLAAKVSLDAAPGEAVWLPPLQVSYETPVMGLPIKLGTLNSPGSQDVILHVLTSGSEGAVQIANLPEVKVEGDDNEACMLRDASEPGVVPARFLADFSSAVEEVGGSAYTRFHAWDLSTVTTSMKCDPCPPLLEVPGERVLTSLGLTAEEARTATLSALRVRYRSDITEDLVLYGTGATDPRDQVRYIVHDPALQDHFPVCGEGRVTSDDPTCEDQFGGTARRRSSLPFALPVLLGLTGLLGWRLRRRWR